jgi:hypothetical protein
MNQTKINLKIQAPGKNFQAPWHPVFVYPCSEIPLTVSFGSGGFEHVTEENL